MMNDEQVHAVAVAALAHWGGARQGPRLIGNRENAVFKAQLADGAHVALRLHRPGYQTDAAIRSELTWMQLLVGSGFRCCTPVPALSGALTTRVGGRMVSALSWIDAAPFGVPGVALAGGKAQQVIQFEQLGAIIGRLHTVTDELALPADFVRPRWDEDGLLGHAPLWGRFWDNPAFAASERSLLLKACEKARLELAEFRRDGVDFGLIHADLLRENVLKDAAGLALIDFDDCGFGFRMYDLGVALVQYIDEPHAPTLSAALITGYRGERDLPDHAACRLQMFVMLRAFASCGWIMARSEKGHESQRWFAQRAVGCAREYLNPCD